MKRKKREIEDAVDDLGANRRDRATYPELVDYLASLADDPDGAPLPTERYTEDIVEGLDGTVPFDLPGDLTPDDLTGLERYGLAYLGDDVRRGVLKMRLAQGGAR